MSDGFALQPYPGLPFAPGVSVSGTAHRAGSSLQLSWRLEGALDSIEIPAPAALPERRHALWEATCFECFLASPEQPGYWEVNLSPAGHWNVFRFEGYRAGMRNETAVEALPFSVSNRPGTLEVALCLDTAPLGLARAPWHLAVAAVVADLGGNPSYWALSHPGAQPDFHHRDARALRL